MINRGILSDLNSHLSAPEITMITGARQVGKTTLMNLLQEKLQKKGKKTLFLSMDFESDKPSFLTQESLINRMKLEFGGEYGYVFMDEIQRKENAGLYLKGIYDMKLPVKMIISGSGSIELKEKIHESLAGRKRIFEVQPVSFPEYLDYRTSYKYTNRHYDLFQALPEKCLSHLNEYLNFGGYPAVITAPNLNEKIRIINEIFTVYIEKDIQSFLSNDGPEYYSRMIKLLAAQTGQMINLSTLSSDTSVSVPTLQKYLWYADKTCFIKLIQPYIGNKKKEITKSPVVYFNDHGMRNFAIASFGNINHPNEYGFAFQNLICNLLLGALQWNPYTLHFWRTTDKAEVDFVISRYHDPLPIEVKFRAMKKHEITRSLRSFIDHYKPSTAWIINLTMTDSIQVDNTTVNFITLFDLPSKLDALKGEIENNYHVEEATFPYRILKGIKR